jgi:phage terminase large subunit-like protein
MRIRKSDDDGSAAGEVIVWIEKHCRIPDGRDVGKPVKLRSWQKDNIRKIYDNPAGTRRAIISFGRKNGKTAFAAFLLLVHLCGPKARPNSQLISAAQSRDQAALLFGLASKIIRLSPTLNVALQIRETVKEILSPGMGTHYKAMSAEASTAFGLSPIFIVHDELGQVQGGRSTLYEALETAVGAHDEPLSIVISTQAPTDNDLLSVLIDDARSNADERVVLSLYTAGEDLNPFSEEAIRAANPAYGDFLNSREVLAMAADARRMPSRESEYRNLVLNQRVESTSPFISRTTWDNCHGAPIESLEGYEDLPYYAGLDLSATSDLTALVLIAPQNGRWYVQPTFWLPREGLREKAQRDRVPYDLWHRDGYLETTPGRSVEYQFVAEYLRGICDQLDIVQIGFDAWNWKHFSPWLTKAGFTENELETRFRPLRQNYQEMSPALRSLESGLLEQKIIHDGHPVMSMCVANAVVVSDGKGNRMLTKAKSHGRIDGLVALAMAHAVAGTYQPKAAPDYASQLFFF